MEFYNKNIIEVLCCQFLSAKSNFYNNRERVSAAFFDYLRENVSG